MFDIALKFSVETAELINARNALQSLAQTAGELNKNQDKAAGAAERLAAANEKSAKASSDNATASKQVSDAADKVAKSTKGLAEETDAATARLQRINDQLGFLRNDLELSETGFTKSQAGVLAWAKSVGASESTIKEFAGTFDKFNKVMGEQSLDKSVNGFAMLNRQIREYEQSQKLAAEYTALTSNQVKMLARDLETLKQQNEAFGKSAGAGAAKLTENFVEAATKVNAYNEAMRQGELAAKAKAVADVAAAKASIGVMDQAVARFRETEAEKMQIMESNRKKVNEYMMQSWAGGVGKKSDTLSQMAAQYAEEERLAAAHNTKMQQLKANADKIAADAIAYLDRETARLIATNDSLSRGFTQASSNALFKYKEALELTGASAMEVKQKLYLLEQELLKKQNLSPFAKMQEDMKSMQEQTKHLARAISVQLGDVFVSLASGQNLFTVMIQQGDQIRGALQQAKDAGQDLGKAMQGAFGSMFSSFTLVGTVLKDFVVDGFKTVAGAVKTLVGENERLIELNKRIADSAGNVARQKRLQGMETLIVANTTRVLLIAAGSLAVVLGGILLAAFVQLSKEQDRMAQAIAQTGGYFGATSEEAIALSKSLMNVGVSSSTAATVIEEMAKTGNLGKESFAGIAQAANDAQKYVGVGVDETVKKFSELIKDPIKILNEFAAQTGLLSQEQIGAVSALLATGDAAGAQKLAIELLQQGYTDMTNEAKAGMSSLGLATVGLKDGVSSLWDEFKNSSIASGAIQGVIIIVGVLNAAVQTAIIAFKSLWATVVAAGKNIANIYQNMLSPSAMLAGFTKIGNTLKSSIVGALDSGAAAVVNYADATNSATGAVGRFSAAEQKANAERAAGNKALEAFTAKTETSFKEQAASMTKQQYAQKRLMEDIKDSTKGLSDEQRQAFLSSEKYGKQATEAMKKYGEEWDKAQKKTATTPKGPKPAETYKVVRSNELAETKKQFDEELKLLKDAESTKRELLKDAYAARRINYGKYVASEIELTIESQKKQLAVIEQSTDKRKDAIQNSMQSHVAAFEAELKAGGNAEKLTAKIAAELGNLARQYQTVTVETETQTQALQNATDKRFSEFYKDLAKAVNESNDSLEKFKETVDANAASRMADLDMQRKMLGVYGAEAEALKASAAAMKTYNAEIKKKSDAVADNQKKIKQLEDSVPELTSFEAVAETMSLINDRRKADAQLQQNLNDTIETARVDAAQAGSDAIVAYNLKVFQEVRDGISNALYDAIFEGGSKGGDALKQVLKNMFKNYVINVILNPISGAITGALGLAGSANAATQGAGAVGEVGTGASILGSARSLSMLGSNFAAGFTSTVSGWFSSGAAVASLEAGGMGAAFSAGAAVPYIGAGLVAANALGLFRKTTQVDNGIKGTIGYDSDLTLFDQMRKSGTLFSGPSYWDSDKAMDPKLAQALDTQVRAIYTAGEQYAAALGLTATGVRDITRDIRISTEGLTDAQVKEKLDAEFAALSETIAQSLLGTTETVTETIKKLVQTSADAISGEGQVGPEVAASYQEITEVVTRTIAVQSEYARAGETSVQTLTRLSTSLMTVNSVFDTLGTTMYESSLKGGDMASKLVDLFGGAENFSTVAGSYYDNFYSESEKHENLLRQTTDALAEQNLVIPTTREAYRQLVEAQDLTTEAGRANYAVLLKNAGAFAELTPAAAGANKQIVGLNKMFAGLGVSIKLAETKFDNSTKEMFESLGVSVEDYSNSIADVIAGIATGKIPAEDAGAELANAAVGGITDAIAQGASQAIAAQFVNSIITPIIANVVAGRAAMEGVDLDGAIAATGAQMQALQAVLTSPEVFGGFASLTGALSGLVGAAQSAADGINAAGGSILPSSGGNAPGIYGGGFGGSEFNAPIPGSFGGTESSQFSSAGQYAFTLPGYSEYQAWVNSHRNPTPNYNGGTSFAIGGTVSNTNPQYDQINYVNQQVFEKLNGLVSDAVGKTQELMQKIGEPVVSGLEKIDSEYSKLLAESGSTNQQKHVDFFKTRIAEVSAIKKEIPDVFSSIDSMLLQWTTKGFSSLQEGRDQASEFVKQLEAIPLMGGFSDFYKRNNGVDFATDFGGELAGMGGNVGVGKEGTLSGYFKEWISEYIATLENPFGDFRSLETNLTAAQAKLDKLNTAMREWRLSQMRLLATEELATLTQETQAARDKTEELKRTGGLEDPVTKLKEQFAQKMKTIDDGIGKALLEEIDILKNTKADTSKLTNELSMLKQSIANYTSEGNIKALEYLLELQQADFANLSSGSSDYYRMEANIKSTIELLRKIHSGEYAAEFAGQIEAIEKQISDAVLATTDPAKRAALQAEIDSYKGGITEWFKAQAELLSTEMLIDINNQIKELEATEKGPLTAIKEAIQKYIEDFKVLGTYTAEVEAAVNKLSDSQLAKARKELYDQLIPEDELKMIRTNELNNQFKDLGKTLPGSTEELRSMIDAARQAGNNRLADNILELVPAFIALQGAAEGVAGGTAEDIRKTFEDAYESQLGRAADPAGLAYWVSVVKDGTMTMEQAMEAFAEGATGEKLNRRIMELTDAEGYLAMTRANELSLLSPANKLLQQRIYNLEDEAKALAFANEISRTRSDADLKLLQAQGNTAAAEALQRQQFIAGLTGLTEAQKQAKIAAYDYGVAIDKQVRILNERTGLENRLNQSLGNTALLRSQELAKLDENNRALQQRIWAIEDADKAVSAALAAVERAIDAEKDRVNKDADARIEAIRKGIDGSKTAIENAQKQVDALKEIFEKIADAVKTLRGTVDKERQMQDARAYIDMSLMLAKVGTLPDKDKLFEAIDIVSNNETTGYATLADYNRAQLIQANKLEELGSILGVQKTTEEKQLEALNNANKIAEEQIAAIELSRKQQLEALDLQLAEAKRQVDVMRGVDISVQSVDAAVTGLSDAIASYQAAIIEAISALAAARSAPAASVTTIVNEVREYSSATYYQTEVTDPVTGIVSGTGGGRIFSQSIGAYATGGSYPGGMALVGEEGPELINFSKPGQVYTAAQSANLMRGDNTELVLELQALRSEVSMLRAEARATAVNTSKTARILDDVTQGGDTLKTEVAA